MQDVESVVVLGVWGSQASLFKSLLNLNFRGSRCENNGSLAKSKSYHSWRRTLRSLLRSHGSSERSRFGAPLGVYETASRNSRFDTTFKHRHRQKSRTFRAR